MNDVFGLQQRLWLLGRLGFHRHLSAPAHRLLLEHNGSFFVTERVEHQLHSPVVLVCARLARTGR